MVHQFDRAKAGDTRSRQRLLLNSLSVSVLGIAAEPRFLLLLIDRIGEPGPYPNRMLSVAGAGDTVTFVRWKPLIKKRN